MSKLLWFFVWSGLLAGFVHGEARVTAGLPASSSLARSTISAVGPVAIGPVTNAWGVAYDPATRRLYASDPTTSRIVALNATTGALIGTVLSEPGAVIHGMVVDPRNRLLWFLDSATDQVRSYKLDLAAPGPAFPLPGSGLKRPNEIALDPVRNELFVADSAQNTVVRFDLDGAVRGTWSHAATADAWGVAVAPGGLVYVSSYQNGTVYSWNRDTQATTLVASGLSGPRGLAFDRFGRLLCLASGPGTVMRLNVNPAVATPFTGYANGRSFRCDDTTDEDADVLPDAWELPYGNLNSYAAASDVDHDGQSAFAEAAFGGRPDRSDGAPLVPSQAPPSGNPLTINYPVRQADGFSYRIWASTNLQNWWVPAVSISDGPVSGGYAIRHATMNRASNGFAPKAPVFFRIETFKSPDF